MELTASLITGKASTLKEQPAKTQAIATSGQTGSAKTKQSAPQVKDTSEKFADSAAQNEDGNAQTKDASVQAMQATAVADATLSNLAFANFSHVTILAQQLTFTNLHMRSCKDSVDAAELMQHYALKHGVSCDVDMPGQPANVYFDYTPALKHGFCINISSCGLTIEAGSKEGFMLAVQQLQQIAHYAPATGRLVLQAGVYEANLDGLQGFVSINAANYTFSRLCEITEQLAARGCSAVVFEMNADNSWAWRSELFEQVHNKNAKQLNPQQLELLAKLCARLHIRPGLRFNIEKQHAGFKKGFDCEMTTEEGMELATIMLEELAQTIKCNKKAFIYLHVGKSGEAAGSKLAKQAMAVISANKLDVYSNVALKSGRNTARLWQQHQVSAKAAAWHNKVLEVNLPQGSSSIPDKQLAQKLQELRSAPGAKLPAALCYRLAGGKSDTAQTIEKTAGGLWQLLLLPSTQQDAATPTAIQPSPATAAPSSTPPPQQQTPHAGAPRGKRG